MEIGEKVKITTKDHMVLEGFIYKLEDNLISLKLENGYNVGIKKSRISSIESREKK